MRIGLFFGSFNPVHSGHMILANYMASFTDLEEVWFVVSPQNPLKDRAGLLHQNQRLHMVNLAIGDHPHLRSSNIEFHLPQPSYTIHTLAHLKEKFPEHQFCLIMGADNLQNFHKWKNYEEILRRYPIYVYPRHGFDGGALNENASVNITEAPIVEISSTFIRQAIRAKRDVFYFLPEAVWKYIDEMNFYKG